MKHILTFLFFALTLILSSNAQILEINKPLFSDLPFFNTRFIRQNNVKSIKGSISSKKVRDIIRSNNLDYLYLFNEDGTLKSQLASHFSKGLKDSTVVSYEYKNNNISLQRKSDSYGYYSYHYNYDAQNNISTQTYCRDENKFNSKKKFELKKQYIIVKDSFSHQQFDNQTKKTFYNSYGKKFKTQTNYYDSLGYLVEEYTKFIIGNNKEKTTYEYDEIGRIYKKHVYTNISKSNKNTEVHSYDDIGNILDIKFYKEDNHTSTKQFLYDKNMLLSAMIIQDMGTDFLRIIKYRYTFYDGTTNYSELDSLNLPK
tara:strand:+ start:1605 stop:2543 length:939 start_codon:yes stop_codon:yes gene_type:complete